MDIGQGRGCGCGHVEGSRWHAKQTRTQRRRGSRSYAGQDEIERFLADKKMYALVG